MDYKEKFYRLINAVNAIADDMLETHEQAECEFKNKSHAIAYLFGYTSGCLENKAIMIKKITEELKNA